MSARDIHIGEIHLHEESLFFFHAGLGDDLAARAGDKTLSPEFKAVAADGFLQSHTIDGGHKTAIGHGVTALDGFPRAVLVHAKLFFLARMPADGCGIKKNLRALHRRESRRLRIPLIPADEHADLTVLRLPRAKARVAGCEIKLLVEERVVGDVHLAVDAQKRAIGVNDDGGVVIETGGALLKKRSDDDDLVFLGELLEGRRTRAGDAFGELEILVILALTEILRNEKFLRADDFRAVSGRAFGEAKCLLQIGFGLRTAGVLKQSEGDDVRFAGGHSVRNVVAGFSRVKPRLACECELLFRVNVTFLLAPQGETHFYISQVEPCSMQPQQFTF